MRANPLTIAIAALVIASAIAAPIAGAETFRQRPPLTIQWVYEVSKGLLRDMAPSPKGGLIALTNNLFGGATSGRVIFLGTDGNPVWVTDDLGHPAAGLSWSPNGDAVVTTLFLGDGVAIINVTTRNVTTLSIKDAEEAVWSPDGEKIAVWVRYKQLRVISPNGTLLLSAGFSNYITTITWDTKGELLLIGTTKGMEALNLSNPKASWGHGDMRVREVSASPDSSMIAVAFVKNPDGPITRVDVLSANGTLLWSVSGYYSDIAWRPGTDELLVTGLNTTLYDSEGGVIWSLNKSGGLFFAAPTQVALWHPSGDNVTIIDSDRVLVLNASNGDKLWEGNLGFAPSSAEWVPGDGLALLGAHSLYLYGPPKDLAKISLSLGGCDCSVVVSFSDGNVTKQYTINRDETLDLYATPGNYAVTYYLFIPPRGLGPYVGDIIGWLMNHTVTQNLSVEAGREYTIAVPVDEILEAAMTDLANITLRGPPGAKAVFRWGPSFGQSSTVDIPETGEVVAKAVPGTYVVQAFFGSAEAVNVGNITLEPGQTLTIDLSTLIGPTTTTATPPATRTTTTTTTTSPAGVPEAGTTTTAAETATTTSAQTQTTPAQPSPGTNLMVIIAVAVAVAVIAAVLLLRARK